MCHEGAMEDIDAGDLAPKAKLASSLLSPESATYNLRFTRRVVGIVVMGTTRLELAGNPAGPAVEPVGVQTATDPKDPRAGSCTARRMNSFLLEEDAATLPETSVMGMPCFSMTLLLTMAIIMTLR